VKEFENEWQRTVQEIVYAVSFLADLHGAQIEYEFQIRRDTLARCGAEMRVHG
jgi:DNA-dependent RNA polymerase auxiliary subunit epsilon